MANDQAAKPEYPAHDWGRMADDPFLKIGREDAESRERLRRTWVRSGGDPHVFDSLIPAQGAWAVPLDQAQVDKIGQQSFSVRRRLRKVAKSGSNDTSNASTIPAVPIRGSVTNDAITCLECGRKFKAMTSHLRLEHGLSPKDYRTRWDLPPDYPLVAPAYSAARSDLAKTMGLGRKPSVGPAQPPPSDQGHIEPQPSKAAARPIAAVKVRQKKAGLR